MHGGLGQQLRGGDGVNSYEKEHRRYDNPMRGLPEKNTLIIFVKYPEPGKVKSRIASDLGAERAAEVYSRIAKAVIEKVSKPDTHGTIICFDPPERENEIKLWLGIDKHPYERQSGRTIGEKMSNAFHSVFSRGAEKAVLIGTDIPEITAGTVTDAFDRLNETDVVLGPAEDGGYYLMGLRNLEPLLFRDIEWSTNLVLRQTIGRIKERKLSYNLLQTLKDVDTADDIGQDLFAALKSK